MNSLYLPQNGLNIERSSLPQVTSSDIPDFLHWLRLKKNIDSTYAEIPVDSLSLTQGDFNESKIRNLMGPQSDALDEPILVSQDHYIIDGQHRFLALLNLSAESTIPAIIIHANVLEALAATKEYPNSFRKNVAETFAESLFQKKEYSLKGQPWKSSWRTLELSKLENKALRQFPNSPAQKETRKQIDALIKKLKPIKEEELLTEHVNDAGIFKAVFLAGAPGSGKDIVLKKALDGHGLTEINSDTALDHLTTKEHLDKKMPESEQERRNVHRQKAKSLQDLRQRLAIHGRNGLIINSTSADHAHIKKIKDKLEALGYDSKMVFVDASDNVSRNRNVERGQRGGRVIPEKLRAEKWRKAQDSRVKLAKEFGGEHYHEFNNDEDLRQNADPDVAGQKTAELDDLHKTVKKFTQTPPKSENAAIWIHKHLSKIAKAPVGNKKQQAKVTPPPADSQAKEEAQKLGLQYYGKGRYGKAGRVSHLTVHDRLIEKEKALKPLPEKKDEKKSAKKKLNEDFEQLFDTDASLPHGPIDFRLFRSRLLAESEPVVDSMEGGAPILGGSPSETQDTTNNGKATAGPKKTLKKFKSDIK